MSERGRDAWWRPVIPPRYRPLLLLLLVAGLLSLVVDDFFRQVLFLPVLEGFLRAYRLYRAFPQNLVWGLLVVGAVVVFIHAFSAEPGERDEGREPVPYLGRVQQLQALVGEVDDSDYARWQLLMEMERVVVAVLQREVGLDAEGARRRILHHDVEVAPEVYALVRVAGELPTYRDFLAARKDARQQLSHLVSAVELDAVVQALEARLELEGEL